MIKEGVASVADRVSSNELKITQELVAYLLGLRRESVTSPTSTVRGFELW
jgi:hypothetical protein